VSITCIALPVQDYQFWGHWAHKRTDAHGRIYYLSPEVMLGNVRGHMIEPARLRRVFRKPRHNFLSAGGELTRPCLIDISSTSHQGRTARRRHLRCVRVEGCKSAGLRRFNTVGFIPH
jgi:hypothetical protein